MVPAPTLDTPRWRSRLPALGVLLTALLVAWVCYARFRPVAQDLWDNPLHDRNAHYWLGLSMGLDLRQGNLLHFLRDLDKTRVWGPLHPLLTGGVLAIGGPDYRLAVLPSLAAWCLTVLFGFLTARRAVPQWGNLAGCLAALFILASPAHRAFALDVMLESLGACLSLMALYYYLVLSQDERPGAARLLALSLTLLFLLKYNYWLLIVLALGMAEVFTRPREHCAFVGRLLAGLRSQFDLKAELTNPLSWGVVVALLLVALLLVSGGSVIELGGARISVRSPDNLLWLAYVLAFIRAAQWWMRRGRELTAGLDARVRPLVYWHVWPAALWMLWPKRLAHFFWYLTRDHGEGEATGGFLDSVAYYTGSLASQYHQQQPQQLELFVAVLMLAGLALLLCRRMKTGGGVLVALTLIACLLTTAHPTCRSRFLHSWIAIVWILAGVGLANIFALMQRVRPAIRNSLAAAVLLALAGWQMPGAFELAHVQEGGIDRSSPPSLQLAEQYLPELAADRVAILSNQPVKFFSWWTYLQKYQKADRVDPDLSRLGAPPEGSAADLDDWVRQIKGDTIVLMEFAPHSRHYVEEPEARHESIRRCLTRQSVFLPVKHIRSRDHQCDIVILRRDAGQR